MHETTKSPLISKSMFALQAYLSQNAPAIQQILQKYGRPTDWIDSLAQESQTFVVRVPLMGAFSSGKSSLLNALLGERVFTTSIDPQTAVPAELRYGEKRAHYAAHWPDGRTAPLTAQQVLDNELDHLEGGGWVEVTYPSATLARWPHLCLVDMPGLDAGIERHSRAIDGYADRSLAYCVVVSAKEGTLHQSVRNALVELQLHNRPVVAVITKADQVLPADWNAIAQQVSQDIANAMQQTPLETVVTSARIKDLNALIAALDGLEQQSEALFNRKVGTILVRQLDTFSRYLQTLENKDDLDGEAVQIELAQVQTHMAAFEEKLHDENQALHDALPRAEAHILESVESALCAQTDHYISCVLSGDLDLKTPISQTVRLSVAKGIQKEFAPEMRRYLERLAEALPEEFACSVDVPEVAISTSDVDTSTLSTSLLQGLGLLLTRFVPKLAGPIAMIASVLLPVLISNFFGSRDDAAKAEQREQQRQRIRAQLTGTIFPQVIAQIRPMLTQTLQQQANTAYDQIQSAAAQQRDSLAAALQQLQQRLQASREVFAAQLQQIVADRTQVQEWIQHAHSYASHG